MEWSLSKKGGIGMIRSERELANPGKKMDWAVTRPANRAAGGPCGRRIAAMPARI